MKLHRSTDPRYPGGIRVTEARSVLELRAEGEDDAESIVGHGSVFDQETELFPGYFEVIRRGAFADELKEGADVVGLFNHDLNQLLSRSGAGTLELEEDDKGLAYTMRKTDTRVWSDVVAHLRAGNVTGSSFAFRTLDDRETERKDGTTLREVFKVQLFDVGPVTHPAYAGADAGIRALDRQLRNAVSVRRTDRETVGRIARASGLTAGEIRATLESVSEDLAQLLDPSAIRGAVGGELEIRRRRLDLLALEV